MLSTCDKRRVKAERQPGSEFAASPCCQGVYTSLTGMPIRAKRGIVTVSAMRK